MSNIKSKSKPMPEDYDKRFKFEEQPEELIPYVTIRQYTDVFIGDGKWWGLGKRYATAATKPIMNEIKKLHQEHLARNEKKK
jgi:hypothetical protein